MEDVINSARQIIRTIRQNITIPILAVFTAIILGSFFMLLNNFNPLAAYAGLWDGAFGSPTAIGRTILNSVPFIFSGLSVAFAFKGGFFNIGGEGQLFFGAVTAAWIGIALDGLPPVLHISLSLLAGFMAGALWGSIPGALKAYTGAHEVITTIMFNYISLVFVGWLVSQGGEGQTPGPLRDPDPGNIISRTAQVAASARLPVLFQAGSEPIHLGVLITIPVAFFIWWLVWRSTFGFGLRMMGLNSSAARYAGVNVPLTTIVTMAIAGGLAGMAGAIETLGRNYYFAPNFNVGYGFDGIAIALLGKTHPLGVVLSAILFGAMDAGSTRMQLRAGVPGDLIKVIQALILMLVAASEITRFIYRLRGKREVQAQLSAGWGKK